MTSPLKENPEIAKKAAELLVVHGTKFERLVEGGRLPRRQIANFFGRHQDRQHAILEAMEKGLSYSASSKRTSAAFDTKRWGKIPMWSASCRGLILKIVCGFAQDSLLLNGNDPHELAAIAVSISEATTEQMRYLCQIEPFACPTGSKIKRRRSSQNSASKRSQRACKICEPRGQNFKRMLAICQRCHRSLDMVRLF